MEVSFLVGLCSLPLALLHNILKSHFYPTAVLLASGLVLSLPYMIMRVTGHTSHTWTSLVPNPGQTLYQGVECNPTALPWGWILFLSVAWVFLPLKSCLPCPCGYKRQGVLFTRGESHWSHAMERIHRPISCQRSKPADLELLSWALWMANGALCCFQPPAEPAQAGSPTPAVAVPSVRLGARGRGEMLQGSQSFNMGLFPLYTSEFQSLGCQIWSNSFLFLLFTRRALQGQVWSSLVLVECLSQQGLLLALLPLAAVVMQHGINNTQTWVTNPFPDCPCWRLPLLPPKS